tara:strand:+ start:5205 stop:5492 length:288 start_codon:yes stop_codon:yes gene_type:complete
MNNKQQLVYNIEKRFKTTMIGSLAQFEKRFQHLWEDESIDPDRREYYSELWQDTRDEVLNNGNHQSRSAIKDLKSYLFPNTIKNNYKFYFKEGDE